MSESDFGASESPDDATEETGTEQGLFSISPKLYSLAFYGILLLWMGWLLLTSFEWRWKDQMFVLLAGIPTILFLLAQIARIQYPELFWIFDPERLVGSDEESLGDEIKEKMTGAKSDRPKQIREQYELQMLVSITAMPFLMYFVGFSIALPVFVFANIWYFYRDMKVAIGSTIFVTIIMYIIFVDVLEMLVWEGALGLPNLFEYIPF